MWEQLWPLELRRRIQGRRTQTPTLSFRLRRVWLGRTGMRGSLLGCRELDLNNWITTARGAKREITYRMPAELTEGGRYTGSFHIAGSHGQEKKKWPEAKGEAPSPPVASILCCLQTERNFAWASQKRNVYRVQLQCLKAGQRRRDLELRHKKLITGTLVWCDLVHNWWNPIFNAGNLPPEPMVLTTHH